MSEIDAAVLNWSDLGVSELVPTGTVTLLLADVEGSTRLWETQPDEMTAAFANLDRTLAELVGTHGGVRPVEQGEGDSFVIAFGRASDAVACALDLQRAPLAPIRLRIGLHTGEVQLRDESNYIGPTINRTARIRDLAHGGQTVLSGPPPIWYWTDFRTKPGWLNSAPTRSVICHGPSGWFSSAIPISATNSRHFAPPKPLAPITSRRSSPASSDVPIRSTRSAHCSVETGSSH